MSPAAGSHATPGSGRLGPGGGPPDAADAFPPADGADAADAAGDARQAVIRARHAASKARLMAEGEAQRARLVRDLFAQPVHAAPARALARRILPGLRRPATMKETVGHCGRRAAQHG